MATERRLGRGLESLLGGAEEDREPTAGAVGGVREVPIGAIRPNPMQPRSGFDEREMAELVESVREVGVLQPLVVRRAGEGYEVIAGERRLRAAEIVGLAAVPVVERKASDDEMLTLALVENLQREDLNPIEKGKGFKALIERFELTQEEAAKRIGKDRSSIANFMRLLELPEAVQHVVSRGTISMGHARALLGLSRPSAQQALALRIEDEGLSVRQVERTVAQNRHQKPSSKPRRAVPKPAYLRDIEDRARERLGSKVLIESKAGRGRVIIHFFSDDDFQRILDAIGISD